MASQTIGGSLVTKALGGYGTKPTVPDLPRISLDQQQGLATAANQAVLPETEKLATAVNTFQSGELRRLMDAAFPFFGGLLAKGSENTASLLRGELPADVSRAVEASAAARALGGGYGGSGMGRALTLRDLGRTSFDATQQGLMNFGQLAQLTRPLMPQPFDVSSMFVTPLQRASFENEQNLQQFQRNWMSNQIASQPDPFKAALGDAFNNLFATAASFGMGSLGGMMGGAPAAKTAWAPTSTPPAGTTVSGGQSHAPGFGMPNYGY